MRGTAIEKWRENIGVVPQDVFIFNGTVMDNLLLSGVDTSPQYIIDVCSRYGVDKYIARLPQGYHTVVGEEGINLSGGQKQLIAFARILVKNPSVLILDESTSAMANKATLPVKPVNYLNLTDEVRELHKIKEVGTEEILGRKCTKYTLEVVYGGQTTYSTVWIWKGIPLKNETSSNGMVIVTEQATEIQENAEVPAGKFLVPEGVTFP